MKLALPSDDTDAIESAGVADLTDLRAKNSERGGSSMDSQGLPPGQLVTRKRYILSRSEHHNLCRN